MLALLQTFLWSLGSELCLFVERERVLGDTCALSSVTSSICSRQQECRQTACFFLTVDIRLCASLQVTAGDHLVPRVRSARSRSLLWPEFSDTHSSQAYMCTQSARRAVRRWFPCAWRNMLKLSHPGYKHMVPRATSSTFQGKYFTAIWNPSSTQRHLCACLNWLMCLLLCLFCFVYVSSAL